MVFNFWLLELPSSYCRTRAIFYGGGRTVGMHKVLTRRHKAWHDFAGGLTVWGKWSDAALMYHVT
jgi:hypothetical protein